MPRAGQYIHQAPGYRAFIPEPLPPNPAVEFDGELQTLLSRADRSLGRLDGSIQTLPNPDLFVFMYVRKEAVLSSQIEGTQSSINDVLRVEAQIFNPEQPQDVNEVLNYVHAMTYGLQRLAELPVSIRLIREIHQRLLHDVRGKHNHPGEIRQTQNWIGPQGCTLKQAIFVPPPPHEVMKNLGDLETFIHGETNLPVLIQIGLVHSQFETIHPFLDGNGRVGRLLIAFLLCEKEVLIQPVLYLSHYFKRHRAEYYECLQQVRDDGNWEKWLKFFLDGVAEVSLEATETSRRIVALRETDRDLIVRRFGRSAAKALIILEGLYERPFVSIADVSERAGITFPAASKLVQKFVDAGILVETTGQQRYRVFSYDKYIDVFAGD